MPCIEEEYADFFGQVSERLGSQRALQQVTITLTERCNLRCAHCFIHDASRDRELLATELSSQQWFGVFDQLADAGCIGLLLTGGEPLLRADFAELYQYAKRKGFLITLFTNGTLLTADLVALLQEWYPLSLEISLYGITPETYEGVTGVPGSFERCIHGIEMVVEAGIPLRLKTVAMTLTPHEIEAMYAYAADLGVPFRHDGSLWPSFNGKDVSDLRLSPADVVALDAMQPDLAQDFLRLYEQSKVSDRAGFRYTCRAGLRSCHIGADGKLYLCQMSRTPGGDLTAGTLQSGWEALEEIRAEQVSKDFACLHCDLAGGVCQRCPAFAILENGDPDTVVEFACSIAQLRAKQLGLVRTPGLDDAVDDC